MNEKTYKSDPNPMQDFNPHSLTLGSCFQPQLHTAQYLAVINKEHAFLMVIIN